MQLPSKEAFNSKLNGLDYCGIQVCETGNKKCIHEKRFSISTKEYEFAQKVWKEAECKTLGDYHDLYLKTDVLILADGFQEFRKVSMKAFELDPANYLTAPGLA